MVANPDVPMWHAVILAGGFGTRLRSRVNDRPKALAEVAGKPFIAHQIEWLIVQGVSRVSLAVHYLADQLQEFAEQWSDERITIDCVYEGVPLGTGGAVANVIQRHRLNGKILVMNGDTLFQFSLKPAFDQMRHASGNALLIAGIKNNVARFGTVEIDGNHVCGFQQATGQNGPGIVNAGVYLLEAALFRHIKIESFSLEYDLFPQLVRNRELLVYLMNEKYKFHDIGTPESYDKVRDEIEW